MRSKEVIASIAVVGAVATFAVLNMNYSSQGTNFLQGRDKYEMDFNNYVLHHRRNIGTLEEYNYRLGVYIKNVKFIEQFNTNEAEKEGYELAINHLADITQDEFKMMKGYSSVSDRNKKCAKGDQFEAAIDWTSTNGNPLKVNAVSPVKNQGSCGSCWAFSAIGAVEGAYAIQQLSKSVQQFSEQQLVDCDTHSGNMGCNGGDMGLAFDYIISNGIDTEEKYGYVGYDEKCKYKDTDGIKPINDWCSVKPYSADALKYALNHGPVAVAIEADTMTFQFYSRGTLTSSACGTDLDHGVLAVGYGTDNKGLEYFMVKNSWGKGWGQSGFIQIGNVASLEKKGGVCGILMEPVQPLID